MKLIAAGLICSLALMTTARAEDNATDKQAAISAAEAWLELTDAGEYGQAWDAASEYLQKAVKKEQFEQALQGLRSPLGELESRELKSATYDTSLPGAPDGDYYVIQFDASFADKEAAIETITPMKTADGTWKVSGYYVK